MPVSNKKKLNIRAQTATELAVFGAVLIFMIGGIVRQSMSYQNLQHQSLRALRMAMLMSYEYSHGVRGEGGVKSSRDSATVIIIEDRLSPDSDKFGPLQRNQSITQGSATHTNLLFMPPGKRDSDGYPKENPYGQDYNNLPTIDMFINGQHFPFTVAGIKSVDVGSELQPKDHKLSDCVSYEDHDNDGCWVFYKKVVNYQGSSDYCDADSGSLTDRNCETHNNMTADCRFDLDRSASLCLETNPADTDGAPNTDVSDPSFREKFGWQWVAVPAFSTEKIKEDHDDPDVTIHFGKGIKIRSGENISVDVDDDLFEEQIIWASFLKKSGLMSRVQVLDYQEGDMDFAEDPPPGFTRDMRMYSETNGTYYQVREGKLYGGDEQFIRTVQKKDTVDLVERIIYLSNSTGRFCQGSPGNWSVTPSTSTPWTYEGMPNPVEACGECFGPENIAKTCMGVEDAGNGNQRYYIAVRSRIADKQGRKWITNTSDDPYVELQTN